MIDLRCTAMLVLAVTAAAAQTNSGPELIQGAGNVAGLSFDQECQGELRPGSEAIFETELGKAEKALAAGDADTARQAMNNALRAIYRSGADNTDVSVKCLGKPTARRWFSDKLALQRLSPQPELYVTAADRGRDGLIEVVSQQPAARFVNSLRQLKDIAERIDADRRYGAFILPEEDAIATACRAALPALTEQARQHHRDALSNETRAFNRPATAQEKAAADSLSNAQAFASAMAGVDVDTGMDKESLLVKQQVRESMQLLRKARDWNPDDYSDVQSRPTSVRARERGDTMLARANDPAYSLETRDQFYRAAIDYYEFGNFDRQAANARSARDSIQASLNAEQQQRKAELEQALKKKQQDLQQAQENMMKTEAEKKKFKDEADALEAELDL